MKGNELIITDGPDSIKTTLGEEVVFVVKYKKQKVKITVLILALSKKESDNNVFGFSGKIVSTNNIFKKPKNVAGIFVYAGKNKLGTMS
ncbi:MAG: hypothetical protein R3B60_01935 [Candidatus Paceibacterota bacterium]